MKIFTILSSLLISVAALAGNQGEIAILSGNGDAFYVMVDGTFRNYHPQSNVSMQLTSDRMYNVRVIGAQNNFNLDQNLIAKPDRKMIYQIQRQYGSYRLVFVQESPLYGNGFPGQFGNTGGGCGNNGGHPHGNPYNHPNDNYGQGSYYGGYQAMTPAEFDNLKRAVEHETFSDDKLRVANAAAKNKRMKVSQIKEIARLFTFSSEKLEFTKAAYANCVDKSNYYEVMEVFTFSSDKRALQEYVDAH
jgi:hypothetical protein